MTRLPSGQTRLTSSTSSEARFRPRPPGEPPTPRDRPPAPDARAEIVDVWSRTAPKYRRRAIIFLCVNVVLFAALGCFTYSLRTADPFPAIRPIQSLFTPSLPPPEWPRYADFWKACFNPLGEQQQTLLDFLIFPISVEQVPVHMIIVGLLMASLVTIPILVAMLYRLPAALIFLLIVAFVAVFPWLAITLLVGCVIATARPVRFSLRFATVLLALVPVLIYFFFSTRGAGERIALAMPVERMRLLVPWIIAVIASCAGGAIILSLAHVSNFRPGAIAPMLAVFFATPVVLFYTYVGSDELVYRLIEHKYGPNGRAVFVDMDTRDLIRRAAELRWITSTDKDRPEIKALIENNMVLLKVSLPTELLRQQQEVVEHCDAFIERYPRSRYRWNCLYIRGRALDMRIDMNLFRKDAILRFYSDFPSEASRATWIEILAEKPESPFASVAGLKLAILAGREGKLKLAEDILARIVEQFGASLPAETPRASAEAGASGESTERPLATKYFQEPIERVAREFQQTQPVAREDDGYGLSDLFARKPAASSLNVDPQAVAEQAAQLLSLIRHNRLGQFRDVVYPDNNPISMLLNCDPHHELYAENLQHIKEWFPTSGLRDNIDVRLALTIRDVNARRKKLWEVVDKGDDAAPHALYELGVLERAENNLELARQIMKRVINEHPSSPWALSARRKLLSYEAAAHTPD